MATENRNDLYADHGVRECEHVNSDEAAHFLDSGRVRNQIGIMMSSESADVDCTHCLNGGYYRHEQQRAAYQAAIKIEADLGERTSEIYIYGHKLRLHSLTRQSMDVSTPMSSEITDSTASALWNARGHITPNWLSTVITTVANATRVFT
jgi:hypothetical protein